MAEKRQYITADDLDKLVQEYDPQYILLISARNDGKSYAAKYRALERAYKYGEEFAYLRRYEVDLKRVDPVRYWADFEENDNNVIEKITKGEYNAIIAEGRQYFRLAKRSGRKVDPGPVVGHIHALSVAKSYKSMQFPNIRNILYEEFVTDGTYLYNEPQKLQNYVSTVLRGSVGNVWLIGNTITRINPYFREWELTGFNKMKPGQVDIYDHQTTDEDGNTVNIRVIVHIPNVLGKQSGIKGMFFGSAAQMITGQKWDSKDQPHLMGSIREYDTVYEMVFDFDSNACYYMRLLQHRKKQDRILWYVEPKTTPIQPGTRLVSPRLREDFGHLYTKSFVPISLREHKALKLLDFGRIAYSDNLTGTEFQRALRMSRIVDTGE